MEDVLKYIGTDAARCSIPVTTRNGNVNGSGIDLAGFDGAVAIGVMGAAWAANQGSHAISLEESADNSTYSAPTSTHVLGTALTISGQGAGRSMVGQRYVGSERYIRAVGTHTGGTSNADFGVIIVRLNKRHQA